MGIEQSADCLHLRPGPTLVSSVGPLLPGFELFRPDASSSRQSSPQREPAGYVPQPRLRSNPRAACLGPKSDQLGRAEAMPRGDGRRLEERVQMLSQTQKAQNGYYDHYRADQPDNVVHDCTPSPPRRGARRGEARHASRTLDTAKGSSRGLAVERAHRTSRHGGRRRVSPRWEKRALRPRLS